jgi:hypothetical protein
MQIHTHMYTYVYSGDEPVHFMKIIQIYSYLAMLDPIILLLLSFTSCTGRLNFEFYNCYCVFISLNKEEGEITSKFIIWDHESDLGQKHKTNNMKIRRNMKKSDNLERMKQW